MMTTSFLVSHIMVGVRPDSQNKHKVCAFADLALVDGVSMSQFGPRDVWLHNSEEKTEHLARWPPVESSRSYTHPVTRHHHITRMNANVCLGKCRMMGIRSISFTKRRAGEKGAHWEYVRDRGSHKNSCSSLVKKKLRTFYCASVSLANNDHKHLLL